MAKIISALCCGLIFGCGLVISQMANPQKVLNFLDVTGDWDPSLALVMAGALITLGLLQRIILRRTKPIFDARFQIPVKTAIDKPLIIGSALFGIGWGLLGFCPGPAIVALGYQSIPALFFVMSMLVGMQLPEAGK